LKDFSRTVTGGLCSPEDLERAAVVTQLFLETCVQFLRGCREVSLTANPHGLLPAAGIDLAQKYSARWAYAPHFLLDASVAEKPRERLLYVMTFVVAGLHLAAASFPHLPWTHWGGKSARHAIVLPDDSRVRVNVGVPATGASNDSSSATVGGKRRSTFEVLGRTGSHYRISGFDEVTCRVDLPGALHFVDHGRTTVELTPGSGTVSFTMPELRLRPSGWSWGRGTIYEWLGVSQFLESTTGVQCDLFFGSPSGADGRENSGGTAAVAGVVRDKKGTELGRVRGSWLGPLLCDNEILWRGPTLQPPPV